MNIFTDGVAKVLIIQIEILKCQQIRKYVYSLMQEDDDKSKLLKINKLNLGK